MIRSHSRQAALGALCTTFALTAAVAHADVTLQNSMSVEGVGLMAVGNMSGTTKTTISGDKSRTDSDIQMKSRLVRMLAHNAVGPSATIVRLDEDKILNININKKEYTEVTFEQMRDQMKKMSDQANQPGQKETPSVVDDSQCEWLAPKAEVKKTGEKAQIAGYDAERVSITASQPCKDKKTGSICEIALGLDEWLAPGFKESAEVQKFQKAYAQKMGLDTSGSMDVSQRAQVLFGRYKGIWAEVSAKMQGVKGYPVKSSFSLAMGGEQCQNDNAKQAKSDNGDSQSVNPAALAGQLGNKLGSLFHKKKDDSDADAPPAAATPAVTPAPVPPGDVVLMTVSSQLISVSSDSAAPGAFDVPAGFTKQEIKIK
jgi:hypothetical protein